MQLIPSVTLGGELITSEDVAAALEPLGVHGEAVVFIDERGINENKPRYDPIRDLGTDYELWVDPGIRDTEAVVEPLMLGATQVILATKTILSMKELEGIAELTDNLVLAVDWARKIVTSVNELADRSVEKAVEAMIEASGEADVSTVIIFNHTPDSPPRDLFHGLKRLGVKIFVATDYSHMSALEAFDLDGMIVDYAQILEEEV